MNRIPQTQSRRLRIALLAAAVFINLVINLAAIVPARAQIFQWQPVLNTGDVEAHIEAMKQETGNTTPPKEEKSCNIFTDGVVACAIYAILDVISDWLLAGVVNLVGGLFNTFVDFAFADLASTAFVQVGFGITLGVANMFFVLILLWIAVATIFDFEPYTARSLLPKLIIAALLINFSLAIGNTFIKLSNGIAAIFHQRITGNGQKYMYNLVADAASFAEIQDTTPPNTAPPASAEEIAAIKISAKEMPKSRENDLELGIASRIYKIFISPVFIFVMLAGALFILIRQISLMFLLILGPLAFLFMILPATSGMWSSWWQKLFRWSFFLPAFMFFMFLSLTVGQQLAGAASQGHQAISIWIQYGMTIALMIGSLLVANQMGIYGAGAVNAVGKRMAKGAGKWAGGKAGRMALTPVARVAQKLESSENRFAQGLMKTPFLRRGLQNVAAAEKKQISNFESRLGKFSSPELKRRHEMVGTSKAEKAAIIALLSKRRDTGPDEKDKIPWAAGKNINATIQYMESIGEDTIALKRAVPHFLDDTDKTRRGDGTTERERVIRGLRSEHIDRLDPDFFDDAQSLRYATKHWGSGQYSKMMAFSPNVMAKKFQNAVDGGMPGMTPEEARALQTELIANIRANRSAQQYFKSSPAHGYGYSVPGISDDAPTAAPAPTPAVVVAPEARAPRERIRFDAEGNPIAGDGTTT